MARTNISKPKFAEKTAGGAPAARMSEVQALRRSVFSCLLWENEFYEDGVGIGERIRKLALSLPPEAVAEIAIEAREVAHLRHVPLWLLVALCKTGSGNRLVSDTIARVVSRADELSELLSMYWKVNGKSANLSMQLRLGLARAFNKFDEYQLAKYDRENEVRLRDVLFLSHAKPETPAREDLFRRLIGNELVVPNTWEVALSAGGDKKESFENLLRTGKLGYMALIKNLRNMEQSGVDEGLIRAAILARKGAHNVLPFRFLEAAKHAPRLEEALETAMLASLGEYDKLAGKTLWIVDVSGSMGSSLSAYSKTDRLSSACALTALGREVCEHPVIYATAGSDATRRHATTLVPARRGFGLITAIPETREKIGGGGIFLKQVLDHVKELEGYADRIVVITDEQDCSSSRDNPRSVIPFGRSNYMVNVASHKNGIGYANWTHIDGFSEGVIRYIIEAERAGIIDGAGVLNRPMAAMG